MGLNTSSVITNMLGMNAGRQLGIITDRKKKSTEKLSSGYRINRAADDAAGLAISEKMRRQIRGLTQASQNMQDGVSLSQVADGYLSEVHDMIHRVNELSVKSANGTMSDTDREYIDTEVQQLKNDMERIFDTANFNEIPLFHQPYMPNIYTDPEATDIAVFHTGLSAAPGGLEFNNIRYNISELQELGMEIDDNGIATDYIRGFEFTLEDGEFVSLNLDEGQSLDHVSRNYEWKAKDDGIYINDKLATTWEDMYLDGAQGVSNTDIFAPGEYSFSYNGMNISFTIDRPSDKDKVMFSINGDEITAPVTWTISAPSTSNRAIAPVYGQKVNQVTQENKDYINDTYRLSATSEGLAIYNATKDTYSSRTAWKDIPLADGANNITDWGKTNNTNTEVTFDNSSLFLFSETMNGVDFEFSFKLSQVDSLEEAIAVLNDKPINGTLYAPASLTCTAVSGATVTISNSNITAGDENAFALQKTYGRAFTEPDNSSDTMTGQLKLIKTTIYGEPDYPPTDSAHTSNLPANNSRISSNDTVINGNTYYIKKSVQKVDGEGNPVTDGSGNPEYENRYFEVKQVNHNIKNVEQVGKRVSWQETLRISAQSTLNGKSASEFADYSCNYHRDNLYQVDDYISYYVYDQSDTTGHTAEELGKSESEMDALLLSESERALLQSNPDRKFNYNYWRDDTSWTTISTGAKVLDNPTVSRGVTVNMPSNAYRITARMTNAQVAAMADGDTKISDVTFSATGNAQRIFSPASNNAGTPERDFDKVKLNVPKKRLDIQAGTEKDHIVRMEWSALNLTIIGMSGTNTLTAKDSNDAIDECKDALRIISENRILFGAYQNRLEHAIRNTDNVVENTTAADSAIRDTDMSKEMVEFSKENILQQAGQTMLAQANQSRQGILQLLQ